MTLSAQDDLLFMHYRQVFRESPDPKERFNALFAMGEFYYLMSDYLNAKDCFKTILQEDHDKLRKIFAYAYLMNMADMDGEKKSQKELSKELMLFQKNIFVFRNTRQHNFDSPLHRQHKVVYSIDKIEFFVEGKNFAKVSL